MTVRFVGRGMVTDAQESCENVREELTLYGFGGLGEVSYDKELKGESDCFERVARLSKQTKGVVVCGCITDTRGMKRKSALLAEDGRLCGVSDMTHSMDGAVSPGAGLRVYDTKIGKIGMAVAEDILFPEVVSALVSCGSDFIVCPYGTVTDTRTQVLLRAYAYLYGTPILLCGIGYSIMVEADGTVAFATPQSPAVFALKNRKRYHLVSTRCKGSVQT